MRRIMLLVALVACSAGLVGCATVTKSPEEVKLQYQRYTDLQLRQLADDWNYFWLMDRHSRVSRWHTR